MAGANGAGMGGSGAGAESWLKLAEGLVGGVHHALNNRMAAVRAVGQVMEADLPADHPLAGAITSEIQKLEGTAGLLAHLGASSGGSREPVLIDGVVADAIRLFEMHHSLRDRTLTSQVAPGLLPVLADPVALLRGILLMLGLAVREGATSIRVVAEGDERFVRLTVEAVAHADSADDAELLGITTEGVGIVLQQAGGTLAEGRLQVEMLTLPEGRRREREA